MLTVRQITACFRNEITTPVFVRRENSFELFCQNIEIFVVHNPPAANNGGLRHKNECDMLK